VRKSKAKRLTAELCGNIPIKGLAKEENPRIAFQHKSAPKLHSHDDEYL